MIHEIETSAETVEHQELDSRLKIARADTARLLGQVDALQRFLGQIPRSFGWHQKNGAFFLTCPMVFWEILEL